MHLQSNQRYFGYPVLEIRRLMRACGFSCFSIGIVADTLRITQSEAKKLVSALVKDGFFVDASKDTDLRLPRVYLGGESDRGNFYALTMMGHALRMATARKPIKRITAERMVTQFIERVDHVNRHPNLLLWIDEVVAFGSFMGTVPTLSDVDLAVTYTRRVDDGDAWKAAMFARVRLAATSGRRFRCFIDKLAWPQREIELRLRKGLPAIHIHDLLDEGSFIRTLPHKCLYVRPQDTNVTFANCTESPESAA